MRIGARPLRTTRTPQGGLGVVAWILLSLVTAIVVFVSLVSWRVLASPDLGAPPGGPSTGDTTNAISANLASHLIEQFTRHQQHVSATLSETDLTTMLVEKATTTNFRNPQARIRDGQLVVNAETPWGPFTLTISGRVHLRLVAAGTDTASVAADIREIDAGSMTLPGFLRDAAERRLQNSVDLGNVLENAPASLGPLRRLLECVRVGNDGVHLGFRRPDVAAQSGSC